MENKANLGNVLLKETECPESVTLRSPSSIIFDGQALVQSLGKPNNARTFGDYADVFVRTVLYRGRHCSRIDVVFDRYRTMSIKAGTRTKRTKRQQPVRRKIESRDVSHQANFLALAENKADLANFLSEELMRQAPLDGTVMVVTCGFEEEDTVKCNQAELDIADLRALHEEADTRIVLHASHCANKSGAVNIIVSARETDVLILLLAHFHEIKIDSWMSAGTAKKPKYIQVHDVYKCLPEGSSRAILPFHALTGCDTTSFFYGQSKQSAYKIYRDNFGLIETLEENELSDDKK